MSAQGPAFSQNYSFGSGCGAGAGREPIWHGLTGSRHHESRLQRHNNDVRIRCIHNAQAELRVSGPSAPETNPCARAFGQPRGKKHMQK